MLLLAVSKLHYQTLRRKPFHYYEEKKKPSLSVECLLCPGAQTSRHAHKMTNRISYANENLHILSLKIRETLEKTDERLNLLLGCILTFNAFSRISDLGDKNFNKRFQSYLSSIDKPQLQFKLFPNLYLTRLCHKRLQKNFSL